MIPPPSFETPKDGMKIMDSFGVSTRLKARYAFSRKKVVG